MGDFFEKNRKVKMALIGAIAAAVAIYLEVPQERVYEILAPILAFIGIQGVADIGKEKARVESEADPKQPGAP